MSDTLEARPYEVDLPSALARALEKRPELAALRKAEALRREDLINAKGHYKPTASVFGGYQWQSPIYENDLSDDLSGWVAGAQVSWSLFDGQLTRGKVVEARANYERAKLDIDDTSRQIELDVRTAYSNFIEAREILESQKTVQEEAEEALRLAEARASAGSATQLDVLDAQTSLTQARTTQCWRPCTITPSPAPACNVRWVTTWRLYKSNRSTFWRLFQRKGARARRRKEKFSHASPGRERVICS